MCVSVSCYGSREWSAAQCVIHFVTSCFTWRWSYLRRNNLLSVDKLGIGHGLPVTFEHHDGLLGVAQVVVVDTVVWAGTHTKKNSRELKEGGGRQHCLSQHFPHRHETSLTSCRREPACCWDSISVSGESSALIFNSKSLWSVVLKSTLLPTGSLRVLAFKVEENTRV